MSVRVSEVNDINNTNLYALPTAPTRDIALFVPLSADLTSLVEPLVAVVSALVLIAVFVVVVSS